MGLNVIIILSLSIFLLIIGIALYCGAEDNNENKYIILIITSLLSLLLSVLLYKIDNRIVFNIITVLSLSLIFITLVILLIKDYITINQLRNENTKLHDKLVDKAWLEDFSKGGSSFG